MLRCSQWKLQSVLQSVKLYIRSRTSPIWYQRVPPRSFLNSPTAECFRPEPALWQDFRPENSEKHPISITIMQVRISWSMSVSLVPLMTGWQWTWHIVPSMCSQVRDYRQATMWSIRRRSDRRWDFPANRRRQQCCSLDYSYTDFRHCPDQHRLLQLQEELQSIINNYGVRGHHKIAFAKRRRQKSVLTGSFRSGTISVHRLIKDVPFWKTAQWSVRIFLQ